MLRKSKYLGLFLDEKVSFKYHLDTIKLKLNTANCLLSKVRHFVRAPSFRIIFLATFDPHLRYGCQIWEQNKNHAIENIEKKQNKTKQQEFKISKAHVQRQVIYIKIKNIHT